MTSVALYRTVTGFGAKLVAGDVGLAKTFWLFYFGVPLAYDVGIEILAMMGWVQSTRLFALLQLALMVYVVPVTVGVYRAAERYKGNRAWAQCAKAFSILGAVALAFVIVMLLSMGGA
jgi:hypothetical protein